jgi:hypothetical protein
MTGNRTDPQLKAALEQLRQAVDYPTTPPLAARVRQRLDQPVQIQATRGPSRLRFWYAAAALLLVILTASLTWPQAREAVADRLGLRGVRITQGPESGPSAPARDPRPLLGTRVDLDTARSRISFPILMPTLDVLGQPDEVYVNPAVATGEVSLVYGPRPGLTPALPGIDLSLIISQTEGRGVGPAYGKSAGPGTQVQYVSVGQALGIWLDGAPHRFQYLGPGGVGQVSEARLAANVLVWEQDSRIIRIEGAMSQDVALKIAASLR